MSAEVWIWPTASVAGIRTARKLSRGKLQSHRWSLSVEFDPKPTLRRCCRRGGAASKINS